MGRAQARNMKRVVRNISRITKVATYLNWWPNGGATLNYAYAQQADWNPAAGPGVPSKGGAIVLIDRGSSSSQRVGNEIFVKAIDFQGEVEYVNTNIAATDSKLDFFLVYDKQNNNKGLSGITPDDHGATQYDIWDVNDGHVQYRKINESGRFEIIAKWSLSSRMVQTIGSYAPGAATGGNTHIPFRKFVRVNRTIRYNEGVTIPTHAGDLPKGNLQLYVAPRHPTHWILNHGISMRIYFQDT